MNQNLTELLEKKRRKTGAVETINWDERRDNYVKAVNDLYHRIWTILAEPIEEKAVSFRERPKQLSENYIGTYTVNDLILLAGEEQVRFSPQGRNIAGASGRVDVVGDRGEALLILNPETGWEFVQSRQPKLRVVPFDEAALTEILRSVMRD